MGIIAMRVRIDLRDTSIIEGKKSNVNQRELERERERERERVRENKEERRNYTYFTQYPCRYMNVGMNFISIFSKFSAIML